MAQDEKYGTVLVDENGHTPFGDDEPIFILRGRDINALKTLDAYADICNESGSPPTHFAAILNVRQRFSDWQASNPELTKTPD